jgi:Ca-activated chloride channel homolog
MFRFAAPGLLLLLGLLPAIWACRRRGGFRPALGISGLGSSVQKITSTALRLHWLAPALKYGALCLMILALARPQWGISRVNVMTEGINIVLAVDISESMAALDFRRGGRIVDRLEAVKGVVRDFIEKRNGDRIGMVVFGTHAYTQLPLTRDYNALISVLERVEIGAAGKKTAVGDAVGISLKRLEDIESKSRVIILLTDGRSNAGEISPEAAAQVAVQKKVKIYTVGVGARGKAPFRVRDSFLGERYVYQQVDIDEETLRSVAEKTGGLYFRAKNTEGLQQIYDTIDRLEKTEVEVQEFAESRELYPYFLLPAFVLLCGWVILTQTRYLKVP